MRSAIVASSAYSLVAAVERVVAQGNGLSFGKPRPFSFELLCARAQELAARPYRPPYRPAPDVVGKIDYETHGKIHYQVEQALNVRGPSVYPTTFFHLGSFFPKSIKMHTLQAGQAREILYSPRYFSMPADSPARRLPKDSGFAGFHVHEAKSRSDWKTQDWVAFLGASYFRAIGALNQYGLSARGVAIDTTAEGGEEFPDFTEFFIESPERAAEPVLIYALLDGPSISGAYRFACERTAGVTMDVECALFLREHVAQLGIAPLTSMFWYAEYDRPYRIDWRPEVHDSDGLALFTGSGERIWRPLNNPPRTVTSSFFDRAPRGFGLLQRDRVGDHYLDGVRYENRPSLWVEPLGDWGEGCVQITEIPTDDEIHDNVVAFWMPREPAKKGGRYHYRYRLHWLADEPYPAENVARVCATRLGRGGEPGRPRPRGVTKFVVEFAGQAIEDLPADAKVEAMITPSRGTIPCSFVEPVPDTKRLRAQFDLRVEGMEPVELRMFLRAGGRPLSETWACQFIPR
ncbi:MAG TPA: glucan biosynthesis protein D [Polyangiales bacterium]